MTTPHEILDLIERFERNIDSYRSPAYNEAQLRQDFLPKDDERQVTTEITENHGELQRQQELTKKKILFLCHSLFFIFVRPVASQFEEGAIECL